MKKNLVFRGKKWGLKKMYQDNKNALPVNYELREYRIAGLINFGSFGITYKAYDIQSEKWVVIKEYFPRANVVRENTATVSVISSSERMFYKAGMDKFIQEAQILARYLHPNIVTIIDLFQANHTAYYVMEYFPAKDLHQVLSTRKTLFTEHEIIDFLIPLLEGLRTVHEDKIFHRDLKPGNILIQDDGVPVLIDFGAAKFVKIEDDIYHPSSMNALTEAYAAPEQFLSNPTIKDIGPFTDIFSLGGILYLLISGENPVNAQNRGAKTSQGEDDPYVSIVKKAKGNYSELLLHTVDNMLSMNKKARPQNVDELLSLLGLKEQLNKKSIIRKTIQISQQLSKTGGNYDMEYEGVAFSLKIPAHIKEGQSIRVRHLDGTSLNGKDAVLYVTVRFGALGDSNPEKGFWKKLSSGDYGLAKTYWLFGVLVGFVFNILVNLVSSVDIIIAMLLLFIGYSIPLYLGIWRAANRYAGSKVWSVLAQIMTIISVLILVYTFILIVSYFVS